MRLFLERTGFIILGIFLAAGCLIGWDCAKQPPAPPHPPAPIFGLPDTISGPPNRIIDIKPSFSGQIDYIWLKAPPADAFDFEEGKSRNERTFVGPAGQYQLELLAIDIPWLGRNQVLRQVVVLAVGTPPGPGPIPPGPGPTPPQPPAPIPEVGFRALIIFDETSGAQLPQGQQDAIYGEAFRLLLSSKAVKGPDGKTPEWRIWGKDLDVSGETKLWQDAYRLPHERLPWLILSNGKTGYSGPLPEKIEDSMALVNKYAG